MDKRKKKLTKQHNPIPPPTLKSTPIYPRHSANSFQNRRSQRNTKVKENTTIPLLFPRLLQIWLTDQINLLKKTYIVYIPDFLCQHRGTGKQTSPIPIVRIMSFGRLQRKKKYIFFFLLPVLILPPCLFEMLPVFKADYGLQNLLF